MHAGRLLLASLDQGFGDVPADFPRAERRPGCRVPGERAPLVHPDQELLELHGPVPAAQGGNESLRRRAKTEPGSTVFKALDAVTEQSESKQDTAAGRHTSPPSLRTSENPSRLGQLEPPRWGTERRPSHWAAPCGAGR